jgi:hypothetical protein
MYCSYIHVACTVRYCSTFALARRALVKLCLCSEPSWSTFSPPAQQLVLWRPTRSAKAGAMSIRSSLTSAATATATKLSCSPTVTIKCRRTALGRAGSLQRSGQQQRSTCRHWSDKTPRGLRPLVLLRPRRLTQPTSRVKLGATSTVETPRLALGATATR